MRSENIVRLMRPAGRPRLGSGAGDPCECSLGTFCIYVSVQLEVMQRSPIEEEGGGGGGVS